jgi:hypothetical protein
LVTKPQGTGKNIYPSYEDSMFQTQSAVGTQEQMEAIFPQCTDLKEFLDESLYPTNDEVVKLIGHILGDNVPAPSAAASDDDTNIFGDDDIPDFSAPSASTPEPTWDAPEVPVQEAVKEPVKTPVVETKTGETKVTPTPVIDDDEAFFNQV